MRYFCDMRDKEYGVRNMFKKISFSYPLFPTPFTNKYCYLYYLIINIFTKTSFSDSYKTAKYGSYYYFILNPLLISLLSIIILFPLKRENLHP